ncbi:MAG: hypothetical protein O2894_13235 [Planctomycetota bacterium]|nr:hypothetical protein [Planctomycetota bacterium]
MLRTGLLPLLVLLTLAGAATAEDDAAALEARLQAALTRLVDLPTAAARATEAAALAGDDKVDLDTWRSAMQRFRDARPAPAGLRHELASLHGREVEISVYVPAGYDPSVPAPLLMAFHGAGGHGRDVPPMWTAVADALGMLVVAPTDPEGRAGWTKTPAECERAVAALRWARRTFAVDESRVFATGISRGGHVVWDLALRYPDRFAALAPMIGGPLVRLAGGHNNLRMIEHLAPVPMRDLQGARDDPILVENLRLAFARLAHFGATDATLVEFPELGHSFDATAVDWQAFLSAARRDPQPARVVRRSVGVGADRPEEGRAFWLEILETKAPTAEMFPLRVDPRRWNKLTDAEKRAFQATEAETHTARAEATLTAPGRFEIQASGVKRLRLLLTPEMLGADGRVEVRLGGRLRTLKTSPDKRVLLREFAERFDRTFLPTTEVVLKP